MRNRFLLSFIFFGLLQFLISGAAYADEIRPGYLALTESTENVFSVVWKVPAKGDKKLALNAVLPDNCKDQTTPYVQLINAAYIQHWIIVCDKGLVDQSISIAGLATTNTDVLLRI